MSSINIATKPVPIFAHEGTVANRINPLQQLIRSVMSCMLWEGNFYEEGKDIAQRIGELVHAVPLRAAAAVAKEARNKMHLRHVPLLVCRYMANHPQLTSEPRVVSTTLAEVIQRPDELTEFLAIYWKDGKCPLSKQVKLGLAKAFQKFNEYQLAKYNRDKDIKLRDVLFLCHSKPADGQGNWTKAERRALTEGKPCQRELFEPGELLYGRLIYDQLASPETWENRLSRGEDKAEVFELLMGAQELGDLAFLRNLRNMVESGVPHHRIVAYGDSRRWGRVLPFRFIAAARVMPQMEPELERWMFKCLENSSQLPGRTAIVIDTSPSMWMDRISAHSELSRFDAAAALAILLREVCEEVRIYAFNERAYAVPPRRGFALRDALAATKGQASCGGLGVKAAMRDGYDRIVVLTDGQWHSDNGTSYIPVHEAPAKKVIPKAIVECSYLIDVSGNKNGIGYADWLHIDGFSEAVVDYILAHEQLAPSMES